MNWQAAARARLAFVVAECLPTPETQNGPDTDPIRADDRIGSRWLRVSRLQGIQLPRQNGPLRGVSGVTVLPARD